MKITVIGCGNAAFAAAADLSSRGYEITLFAGESHKKNFEAIKDTKTIKAFGVGPEGDIPIHEITTNIDLAMKDPDLIICTVPSNAHEDVAKQIGPYLKEGDKLFICPGSTGGALVFAKAFRDMGVLDKVKICEIHTLPYTARKVGKDGVNISLLVKTMYFAAFPAKYNQEMFELIKPLYPDIKMMHNVLEVGLNNGNATTHAAPVVMNAGKIEYYHKHMQFKEGMTPAVAHVVQLLDDERKEICKALGFCSPDIKDRLANMGYVEKRDTLYECIQTSTEVYLKLDGPNELNHRFVTEDVPYCMVPMAELADVLGVRAPLFHSVVYMASAMMFTDYFKSGRTLEKLGLFGMNKEEIESYLQNG